MLALAVFDDGRSPALYAGGQFSTAGGSPANCIARWDGDEWTPLSTGLEGTSAPAVRALTVFDDGSGEALYVGGAFHVAGGVVSAYWASWGCAAVSGDVDGDGDVDFTDLLAVLSSWGPCIGCPADLDGDGTVSFTDLLIVLAGWG